jgi:hypothetical protein
MHSILLRMAVSSTLLIVLLVLTGCGVQPSDSWGDAYVAPASLNLRGELHQKNSTVAVLKHGDHVIVLDAHRRFVKVRTDKGAQGWLDAAELLSPEQMQAIRASRKKMLALPSEGTATVFEPLNVHIDPSRQSPAFTRIPEGGSVAVLARKIEPKITGPAHGPVLTFHRPEPPAKKPKKNKGSKNSFHLPPKPPPPKPPENWQDLPGEITITDVDTKKKESDAAKKPAAPVVMESWTLIRTKDNQCGWVLSRNLTISIPDEVAQYAEGKHITSYFDLGQVNDEEKGVRHNWLWTTLSGTEPYDFDSWRVFIWNRHRHRYETSYRTRDLEGYFPVHVDPPLPNVYGRTFALITKDEDGKLRRRTYLFDGTRVHLSGTEDYRADEDSATKPTGANGGVAIRQTSWLSRAWYALKQKLLGHR